MKVDKGQVVGKEKERIAQFEILERRKNVIYAVDFKQKKFWGLIKRLGIDAFPRIVLFRQGHAVMQLFKKDFLKEDGIKQFLLQRNLYNRKHEINLKPE